MQSNPRTHELYAPFGPRTLLIRRRGAKTWLRLMAQAVRLYRETEEGPKLMELRRRKQVPKRKLPGSYTVKFSAQIIESKNPDVFAVIDNRGKPLTRRTAYRLSSEDVTQQLNVGSSIEHHCIGQVQSVLSATEFPAPTGLATTTPTGGSITASTAGHIQLIPIYLRKGLKLTDVTPANFNTFVRGIDYVLGSATADAAVSSLTDNDKIVPTWTDPVVPAPYGKPSGILVLIGANATFADKLVCAVVALGALTAEISALGANAIGAAVAEADVEKTYRASISGGAQNFGSALVPGTDYNYDRDTNETSLPTGSALSGSTVRTVRWFHEAYSLQTDDSDPVTEDFWELMTEDWDTNGSDSDTARGTLDRFRIVKFNLKETTTDNCVVSNDEGFEVNGKSWTLEALEDEYTRDDGTTGKARYVCEVAGPQLGVFFPIWDSDTDPSAN